MKKINFRPSRSVGKQGLKLPSFGFGGAPLGGLLRISAKEPAKETLRVALDSGVTYVDTAPFYGFGKSERIIGDILQDYDCVVSTKVGRLLHPGLPKDPASMGWPSPSPFHPVYDYSYDGIMRSFEDSLQRMGRDQIDILYVHDIGEVTHGKEANEKHFTNLRESGYRALELLRSDYGVKAIGMGVNETEICCEALKFADWDVFMLAGRYTLLEQEALDNLLPECVASNTSIVIAAPFNSGILVGGTTWNYGDAPKHVIEKIEKLKQVSEEFNVPLPAAALHFPLAHPAVTTIVPGARLPEKLIQIIEWLHVEIPSDYWQALKERNLLHPDAPVPEKNPFIDTNPY